MRDSSETGTWTKPEGVPESGRERRGSELLRSDREVSLNGPARPKLPIDDAAPEGVLSAPPPATHLMPPALQPQQPADVSSRKRKSSDSGTTTKAVVPEPDVADPHLASIMSLLEESSSSWEEEIDILYPRIVR